MKKTMERLKKSKQHRAAFVASQISIGVPFQIRALRKQREWDQKKLAVEAGMLQPRISAMESPGYGSLTLETLKRLASAFDVALVVRFVPFSELIRWSDKFSPDEFKVLGFEKELEEINFSPDNILAFTYLAIAKNVETTTETGAGIHLVADTAKLPRENKKAPPKPLGTLNGIRDVKQTSATYNQVSL